MDAPRLRPGDAAARRPDGAVHGEPFHVVMGFAPTAYGLATLGRASQKQVVNVAQRGGMCAVLVGWPPGRLYGPDAGAGI